MAKATYITLVNKLLRKVNEVETDLVSFNSAIGVTAAAKDAIVDALDAIYNAKYKWPWMIRQSAASLASTEYFIIKPADAASIDWMSFNLYPNTPLNLKGHWMRPINQDEYWQYTYIEDTNKRNQAALGELTGEVPRMVVTGIAVADAAGDGIFVTPPNLSTATQLITFRYFRKPVRPVNATDEIDLPEEWQYVLMAKALYYMYLFYDNNERAAACDAEFKAGIKDMVTQLLTDENQYVYTGQIGHGGPTEYGSKYIR